jgi:phosphoribosyl-dephospho-CoA transferase
VRLIDLKPSPQMMLQMVVYTLTILGAVKYVGVRDEQLNQAINGLKEVREVQKLSSETVAGILQREAARDERMNHSDRQLAEIKSITADLARSFTMSEKERLTILHQLDLRLTRAEAGLERPR